MKVPKLWKIGILLTIASSGIIWTVSAVDCFVCQDCESNLNSSYVFPCKPSQDKCIKLVLMNGMVDRGCGDKKKCAGRDPNAKPRTSRSISEYFGIPRRRIARGLLAAPAKKEQDGTREASSIHCCTENECNKSPSTFFSSPTSICSWSFLLAFFAYGFTSLLC